MASIKDIARMDARDYAYAKMNYGKGAGNRRKLIQARVDSRMSNPEYREAFKAALSEIDYEPVVKKVKTRKDIQAGVDAAKKTARLGRRLYSIYDRNRDIFEPIVKRILG